MLIYGVSGVFAHKKTIKQFLQPMIVPLLLGQFLRATIFLCRSFSIHQCLFGRFYQYLHIFAVYYVHFINKSVFWAQNFRDEQLIPNFFKYPASDIAVFGRHRWQQIA